MLQKWLVKHYNFFYEKTLVLGHKTYRVKCNQCPSIEEIIKNCNLGNVLANTGPYRIGYR